jgi:hypothetical protein
MRKWLVFVVLAALTSLACNGHHHHGGDPTSPSSLPQVAGKWVGDWSPNGSVVHPELDLSQKDAQLTGTFSLGGLSTPITGSVDANLRMNWTFGSTSCSSLTGDGTADGLAPTQINGTINLVDCDGHHFNGPVLWQRSSKQATTPSTPSGSLADLAAWLKKGAK